MSMILTITGLLVVGYGAHLINPGLSWILFGIILLYLGASVAKVKEKNSRIETKVTSSEIH